MRSAPAPDATELLLSSERWPRERLDAWVSERLRVLLAGAREAPFWRERVPPGARLRDVPLLEREELQRSLERMRTPATRPVKTTTTSGSSGRPVTIERGAEAIRFAAAARLRQLTWWGLPPAELPAANALTTVGPDDPPLRRVNDDPPRFVVNAFRLDEAVAEGHTVLREAGGVRLIGATTSVLEQWAAAYERSGSDPAELGVDLAIVGGEVTVTSQRERIGAAFGCRTAEMYGAVEAPMTATECAEGSLHLNEEVVHLEVLGEHGSPAAGGVLGEVVVTPLHHHELPLLRYRLRDAAAVLPGPCRCGRTLKRLDVSLGRLEEMAVHPDGSLLHPRFIQTALERSLRGHLRAFQAVQVEPRRFVVYLDMEDPGELEAAREDVAAELESYMRTVVGIDLVLDPKRARAGRTGGKRRTFHRAIEAR